MSFKKVMTLLCCLVLIGTVTVSVVQLTPEGLGVYGSILTRDLDKYGDLPFLDSSVELIVGLSEAVPNSYAELMPIATRYGGEITNTISLRGKIIAAVVNVTLEVESSFVAEVRTAGLSRYVEPNLEVKACMVPNDPRWPKQWGPQKIQADWAWNTTMGNSSVLVAVIDSGIDYNHPDLSANYARDGQGNPSGYDWVNNDADPMDDFGHGTHCAGIIAGVANNNEGIAGLAQVRIMAEKVLDENGVGWMDDIANGIINATDYGADIISMSIGFYFPSETVYIAIRYAYDNGALLVGSAGNDAISGTNFPAYYKEVIAVGATDRNDMPWSFTNFGTWVELAAPGVEILSTISKEHDPIVDYPYDNATGTSMAAPHVSGVAALVWSQFPGMTRDQVRVHLRNTADDLGTLGFDIYYGYGRVNAAKAVEQNLPEHDLLILDWERPPYMEPGSVMFNITVLNHGASDENNIVVELWMNGSWSTSESIDFLASGASTRVSLSCVSPSEGVYNVTVYVVPVPGEANTGNNAVWAYVGTEQGILKVPDYYPTIQEAVDAAVSGDAIRVSSGTYNEAVDIYKDDLSLIGESTENTIINGSKRIWVVYAFQADSFNISLFTIQNSGLGAHGAGHYYAGVYLYNSDGCTLNDNTISNNYDGIYMLNSYDNTISDNKILSSNRTGIELFPYGDGNLISNNTIESSGKGGIALYTFVSGGDIVSDNVVKENGFGICVSSNSKITGNKIVSNDDYGIRLVWSGAVVEGNYIEDNGQGIYIESASDNDIYHNNFINNTDQVASYASLNQWHGRWNVTGNYWSDYNGTDSDGDGIGDSPYVIDANNIDYNPLMNPYLPGDVKHNGQVDIYDIVTVSLAYGSYPGHPKWNPHADINEDAIIDSEDMDIVMANFGKTWQEYWGV